MRCRPRLKGQCNRRDEGAEVLLSRIEGRCQRPQEEDFGVRVRQAEKLKSFGVLEE